MELDQLMGGGSEQATSSDDEQFILDLEKRMEKKIHVMVIRSVQQIIVPIMEELIRKVVKDEIQSAQEKLLTSGNWSPENETTMSKERSLRLKFLDEVSLPVSTGKVIKGKEQPEIRVALVDKITGQVVNHLPESSSKVEILFLDVKDDDTEDTWNGEDFNSRIITEGDKKKPHFAKSNYINLKKGIGTLGNTKLGHDKDWLKKCKCRLGARMVESISGIKVQEAWTEPFIVSDSRGELYKKHHPPSLSDPVWRLENIGKDGAPCKRLKENQILNVQDFLFLHYIDPQKLQQIVGAGAKIWKATLDHAQTCIIDDKRMYLYYPLSEPRTGVVFDVVGRLRGAIHDSCYVLENNLSKDEQDSTRDLLLSAFGNRNDIIPFEWRQFPESINRYDPTEPSTLSQVVQSATRPSDENAFRLRFPESINQYNPTAPGTLSQVVQSTAGPSDENALQLQFPETINRHDSTEPGTSQTIRSTIGPESSLWLQFPDRYIDADLHGHDFSSLESINQYDPTGPGTSSPVVRSTIGPSVQSYDSNLGVPNQSPNPMFSDNNLMSEYFGVDRIISLISSDANNISEPIWTEPYSHQQSNACSIQLVGAWSLLLGMVRAKKQFMALRGIHVQKRQRTCI